MLLLRLCHTIHPCRAGEKTDRGFGCLGCFHTRRIYDENGWRPLGYRCRSAWSACFAISTRPDSRSGICGEPLDFIHISPICDLARRLDSLGDRAVRMLSKPETPDMPPAKMKRAFVDGLPFHDKTTWSHVAELAGFGVEGVIDRVPVQEKPCHGRSRKAERAGRR